MSKIRFAVIGCSRVALKGVLPALSDSELADFVMAGSRDPEKAKQVAEQFNAAAWGIHDEVMQNKDIDAVYVSVPHALHEELVIRALEAGKHVICEKPSTISYASAKRMVQAAQRNGVRLIEGLMFRYHPQNVRVREMIKAGALGELLRFDGCFGFAMPDKESNSLKKDMGGGTLFTCGVYPVAASRMVFGEEPISVYCRLNIDPETGVDLEANLFLEYPRQKIACAASFFGSYYQSTYSVLGTKAQLRMGRAYAVPREMPTKIYFDTHDQIEEIAIGPADHFRNMVDDFCQEISLGQLGTKDYENDLLAQARVIEAARLSAAEKRVVLISEID